MSQSASPTRAKFLTAEWRHLAMLNFAVDPKVLLPWLPADTELDPWRGQCLVSMVGFRSLGYTKRRDGTTSEYEVAHPPWRTLGVVSSAFSCDVAGLNGDGFRESLAGPPVSALLAEGSAVAVYQGGRLPR